MGAFLEERLPVNIRLGASFVDGYAVEITTTASGVEYRKLTHPHPIRTGTISFTMLRNDLAGQVLDLYHRAYGTYAGFRVKCVDDYSTNNYTGIPTAFDFTAVKLTDTTYQIAKAYGIPYDVVIDRKDLKAKVEKMIATKGPYLLECAIKEDEDIVPMTLPGKSVDEMQLELHY